MAEEHAKHPEENFAETSDGSRCLMEDSTTAAESFDSFTASKDSSGTNIENSIGCASSRDPAASCSEYFSRRIQSIMESRAEFDSTLETEIEESKEHWSELQARNGEEGSAEKNLEAFRSLQMQWGKDFFMDWADMKTGMEVGEKIAEGAQGAIYNVRWLNPEGEATARSVLKVFKEGMCLQDLQKQWPQGMLLKAHTSKKEYYQSGGAAAGVMSGVMLEDGRFAFHMVRCWGDLRKVIDLRMLHNGNQAPPFSIHKAFRIMYVIAIGMRSLHKDNIVHGDLKASNVLIWPIGWSKEGASGEYFNPTNNDNFIPIVADFECSIGVLGTRFWRAPEILLGIKNQDVQLSLVTEKSDVYSYAMTCYEILTGQIPFEGVQVNDYDHVLKGARPVLPSGIEPWVETLLGRCWHHDPSKRPSFKEVVNLFKYRRSSRLSKLFRIGPKLVLKKMLT